MGETSKENDLFYTCSLIEYIARITNNTKKDIVNKLTEKQIKKIYDLAEVYHSENIDKVANELIETYNIPNGNYDILSNCKYNIPTHFDMGKVYKRLIIMLNPNEEEYISTLMKVLSSWLIEHLDNYNSSLYYENPDYLYNCYLEGKIL